MGYLAKRQSKFLFFENQKHFGCALGLLLRFLEIFCFYEKTHNDYSKTINQTTDIANDFKKLKHCFFNLFAANSRI